MIIPFARQRTLQTAVCVGATIVGAGVAWHYHALGLTLSHYDSRGHLIVARRIFDNITPGWQQIGAVWLPLPHLLNALPVQIDFFYRTGASAVAISVLSYVIATVFVVSIVRSLTDSISAAIVAAVVFACNPNILYLQSTPMTEPLLLATVTAGVARLMEWASSAEPGSAGRRRVPGAVVGWTFALACLTRYEAWPVTGTALVAAVWVRWRRGDSIGDTIGRVSVIAFYPAVAIVAFAIFSRVVVGQWFVSTDFFVPENKALGHPWVAIDEIAWGTRVLSGGLLVALAMAGTAVLVIWTTTSRRAQALIPLSLVTQAAIPWAAFVKGHPFRIRYMVPLMAIEAIGCGVLVAAVPWRRTWAVAAVVAIVTAAYDLRPLDLAAPMVVEAQWDRPNAPFRAQVTACIDPPGHGEKIMASMGSLGHYMQEASASGFAIRDFLHEGNGDIWLAALQQPWPYVDWILIEEKAEGGDMLAHIVRERPTFLDGYQRTCEGAGLALYRRATPHKAERAPTSLSER